jgi:hypothetical protein
MTEASLQLPAMSVPVIAAPDVCIVGGGAAGLGAAIGASRCGLDVLMIEIYGFCGGATVAGLSGTICGLHSSGDHPRQIVFGFAGEFHSRMQEAGGVCGAVPFGRTMLVPHDSFVWKETADAYLTSEGVKVLFHTNLISAYEREGRVDSLLVRCAEGLRAIRPRTVIDASGDAEVVHTIAGQSTIGKDGVVQTPTMVFRVGNVDMKTFLKLDPREIEQLVAKADESGEFDLPRHHVYIFPMPNGQEVLCNMTRITFPDGSVPIGIRSADLTFAEIEGRKQARSYAQFLKAKVPGFQHSYLVETGAQVGIRQTRSVVCRERLTNADVLGAKKVPGAATFSAWPIECHGAGELKISYLEDDTYDIPFETLVPLKGSNLFVAGRCLSAEHEAMASARVTAQCLGMGYAAGAGIALALREKKDTQDLSGIDVEHWMHDRGLKTAKEA